MSDEIKIILDLSDEVQMLLEQQGIDLYQELQDELPSVRLEWQSDPGIPAGSKDIAMVILATASLASALTPIIIRILNQITPSNRSGTWIVEETETHHSDGSTTIHRKRIHSNNEQRSDGQSPEQLK